MIRRWCQKFGQTYANGLRRRRPRPGDKWHLDEVFIKIGGKTHYLWRAVDQDGNVLAILVTSRRDTTAATRFFRKLLTGLEYVPRVVVTDKLGSYHAARCAVLELGRTSPVEVPEQPCRELPPTHPPTRTGHETGHLTPARATVPVRFQRHLPTLSARPPPAPRPGLPPRDGCPLHHVERGHRDRHGRLNHPREDPTTPPQPRTR